MEYQKIANLLENIPNKVHRFITKKWIKFYHQSEKSYNTNKQIRFKTSMLRSDLCGVIKVMHILLLKELLLLVLKKGIEIKRIEPLS